MYMYHCPYNNYLSKLTQWRWSNLRVQIQDNIAISIHHVVTLTFFIVDKELYGCNVLHIKRNSKHDSGIWKGKKQERKSQSKVSHMQLGVGKFGFCEFLGQPETTGVGLNMTFARDFFSNNQFDPHPISKNVISTSGKTGNPIIQTRKMLIPAIVCHEWLNILSAI